MSDNKDVALPVTIMEPITLCSNKCCPIIKREGEHWIITDDHGGSVKLTEEELANLIKAKAELTTDA